MTKRAVCVGINEYPSSGRDLRGAVNDAGEWSTLLADHYGFARSDILVLPNAQATRENIMNALKELVQSTGPGDVAAFTISAHGTQVLDEDKEEEKDQYDEAICPYDSVLVPDNLIIDDELRHLIDGLRDGASMVVVLDTCHSGTGLLEPPSGRREVRFLEPTVFGRKVIEDTEQCKPKRDPGLSEESMKAVLLSACRDNELAWGWDLDGRDRGVLSYFAIRALREAGFGLTLRQWHSSILQLLKANRFPQQPQLEGKEINKDRQVFT